MAFKNDIQRPLRSELISLRIMIVIGVICMIYFVQSLLSTGVVNYPALYWMLIVTFAFTCLKVLFEWYYYFSISVTLPLPATKTYTVDILTTFCAGEPYEMIVETLKACQAVTYPHETWLCDEADDAYLKQVCLQLGVHHITRTEKTNAKAGNINNALKYAKGELCVVLDPDHVPQPDFLDPIVGYFDNPEIGYVQIVQAYKNYKESFIAKGAAQQTYQFYGPMMMSMNTYGTVQAIGANCTFRRSALDSIGGHAAGLAEDMHTSMQLHAKGWRSVYLPAVLAEGLVPSTLSAYYKQQLKWARGTCELFVTSYLKLFRHFTWRQKLHYGIIPFHYFGGFIYLINFLLPILSLLYDVSPIKIVFTTFIAFYIPFISSVMLIRQFVQKWVMDDKERGFHVVGGILMIGTWWVYILGIFYTLIRKNVPYIPTPKDDKEENNWPLNIPNLIIIALSVFAIIYGLHNDWNPYTFIMAGIAALNICILSFTVIISRQKNWVKSHQQVRNYVFKSKSAFWKFRHRIYSFMRADALPIIFTLICVTIFISIKTQVFSVDRIQKHPVFYIGIAAQSTGAQSPSVKYIQNYQSQFNNRFNIIAVNVRWQGAGLPQAILDSIYQNGSIPMLNWDLSQSPKEVMKAITNAAYDGYLNQVQSQLKALNDRPVFIRFASQPGNPIYLWTTDDSAAVDYKKAWVYLHNYFASRSFSNIIWLWNPWNAETAAKYFPGADYVDWIGVTGPDFNTNNGAHGLRSFVQLYRPYHQLPVFRSGLPVMATDVGLSNSSGPEYKWLKSSFYMIGRDFNEIKGVIFNDRSIEDSSNNHILKNKAPRLLFTALKNGDMFKKIYNDQLYEPQPMIARLPRPAFRNDIHGIVYGKEDPAWWKIYYPLSKRYMLYDFTSMKKIGINIIKHTGPNVYDRNIFSCAESTKMNILYTFWVPDNINFINDDGKLKMLENKIISTVKSLKDKHEIIGWNIGNTVFQSLSKYYFKPELLYEQRAYVNWLRTLSEKIKQTDPLRPLSVDVEVTNTIDQDVAILHEQVPAIDQFGLVVTSDTALYANKTAAIKATWYYSSIAAPQFLSSHSNAAQAAFVSGWQDLETAGYLTFTGIKDYAYRNKPEYYQLQKKWANAPVTNAMPRVRILKPATTIYPYDTLIYHALILQKGHWVNLENPKNGMYFEWNLVKTDGYGNEVSRKRLGYGGSITFLAPENPADYKIYLIAVKGDAVSTDLTSLKTNNIR